MRLIDTAGLFKRFGGVRAFHHIFVEYWPEELTYHAVWTWHKRGISARAFIILIGVQRNGASVLRDVNLLEYIHQAHSE